MRGINTPLYDIEAKLFMFIESLLVLSENKDVLFSMTTLSKDESWDEYLSNLHYLIPDQIPEKSLYVYDEKCIGVMKFDLIYIIIVAPVDSSFCVESNMYSILGRICTLIKKVIPNKRVTVETFTERDAYVTIQMILHGEFTSKGYHKNQTEEKLTYMLDTKTL